MLAAGCGVYEQGPSSSVVVIRSLQAASGAKPDELGGTLRSDVITMVKRNNVDVPTVFNDNGRVSMAIVLKDEGAPGVTNVPRPLNSVTFTHYRVVYRRTDGRSVQGVDVPYAFDSGLTFSVSPEGAAQAAFEIVRHTAKEEAPLKALQVSGEIINTVTDVTFYGRDLGGKSVTVTGSIGINFGDFGDPTN
jgi:hypothetical protein